MRDTWHRTLVYFGLAEDEAYEDEEFEPYTAPEEQMQDTYRERPTGVRRLPSSRRRRDDYDDIFAEDDQPGYSRATATALRPVAPARTSRGGQFHFVQPKNFNDVQEVGDKFKDSVPVILNLQNADHDLSKRIIDFVSGLTYALDGGMQRIADKVFLLTPEGVQLSAEDRARLVVDEVGGDALSNVEVAQRADIVVLAHKPQQLKPVAREIRDHAKVIVSVLGGTRTLQLHESYPTSQVFAIMPNTPVEVRRGVSVYATRDETQEAVYEPDPQVEAQVLGLFRELGVVVSVPERLFGAATSLSGVGPAYQALLAEAQIDAGIRLGLKPWDAENLVIETMAGTAELLLRRNRDTLAVRREVTSPGGSTARGLAALEAAGIRDAFQRAADAVATPPEKR